MTSRIVFAVTSALTLMAVGCSSPAGQQPAAAEQKAPAAEQTSPAPAPATGTNRQAEFGKYPERDFVRITQDKFQWRPTEGNKLGVETVILEGDPSKPGFYLTINKFPPGV